MENWEAFVLFAFIASFTPGPNNVILTVTGSQRGIIKGMPVLLGIAVGFAVMVIIGTVGFYFLNAYLAIILSYLKYIGLALITWISYQIMSVPYVENETDTEQVSGQISGIKNYGFITLVLFQWLNPKAWMMMLSSLSIFLVLDKSLIQQGLYMGFIWFFITLPACLPWLILGKYIQTFLTNPIRHRIFYILMGAGLLVSMIPSLFYY